MIEQSTDTAIPALMAGLLDRDDPQALVDAHAAAVAAGQAPLAEQVTRFSAHLGQQLRATVARCEHDRGRGHESADEEIHAEEDRAAAGLRILEAVPVLKVAIEMLPKDDVAAIWDQFGPYDAGEDE